jgi:hypothetical protein
MEKLPSCIYTNPADERDFAKYSQIAARISNLVRKSPYDSKYEAYVQESAKRNAIVCVLN